MRIVILGTGTDVGKTFVTIALAQSAPTGSDILALKPIESGVSSDMNEGGGVLSDPVPRQTDGAAIWQASGRGGAPPLAPFVFRDAVSPHLAARRAGSEISIEVISSWVQASEARYKKGPRPLYTLVETAGGVFSPLTPRATNGTLAEALGPALWVLVAPDRIGVLHDVSATVAAMASVHRTPDAVILTSPQTDASTGTNARELEKLGIAKPLAVVGHDASPDLSHVWDAFGNSTFPHSN